MPDKTKVRDLAERAKAAYATMQLLSEEGFAIKDPCDEDELMAEIIAEAYALDPESASEKVTDDRFPDLSPETVVLVGEILNNFSMLVAKRSEEIRNLVINKLLLLSDNNDERIQLRALENLGKIGEVGLFTDRKDVHITHHSAEETKQALKDRLIELKKQADGSYAPDAPDTGLIEDIIDA